MRDIFGGSVLSTLSVMLLVSAAVTGCDGNTGDGTGGDGGDGGSGASGGAGGAGGSGGSGGTGGGGDPCAGKACGDPCTTCPEGAPCMPQACDASGACIDEESVVCSACPSSPPPDGEACPQVGLVCETDEGIVVVCRSRTTCTADGWETLAPGCSSDPPEDPGCPATAPSGTCDAAADPGLCEYGESFCGCTNCLGGPCGGQAEWVCAQPPAAPCPAVAPKLGAPCAEAGLKCVYGACPLGGTSGGRTCLDGVWTEDIIACPQ